MAEFLGLLGVVALMLIVNATIVRKIFRKTEERGAAREKQLKGALRELLTAELPLIEPSHRQDDSPNFDEGVALGQARRNAQRVLVYQDAER